MGLFGISKTSTNGATQNSPAQVQQAPAPLQPNFNDVPTASNSSDMYSNPSYAHPQQMEMFREPTVLDKLKMGALLGGTVGACAGFLFGGFAVLKYGPGQHGYMGTIARYMMTMGGSFAGFMGIGAVIRTQGTEDIQGFRTFSASQRVEKL